MTQDKRDEIQSILARYNVEPIKDLTGKYVGEAIYDWHESEKKRWLESITPVKKPRLNDVEEMEKIEGNTVINDAVNFGYNNAIDEIKKNGGIVDK